MLHNTMIINRSSDPGDLPFYLLDQVKTEYVSKVDVLKQQTVKSLANRYSFGS